MVPPKPQPQGSKASLEAEPTPPPEVEKSPETAAEKYAAEKMGVKGASQRGRADISLESLEERTGRNYDTETPRLINEINFTESADAQKERLQALAKVTVIMLSNIIARNPNIAKKVDFTKFENIPLLTEYFDSIYPKAAENAAMHKLREMRDQMSANVSITMKEKWPEIADAAQKISRETKALLAADFKKDNPEKGKDGFISKSVNFAKNHPVITTGIVLAGAYGLYRLWNWMFPGKGKEEKPEERKEGEEGKEGEKKEPEKKGGFLKWVVGIGIAIGGIFGLGRLLGSDGVKKWIKDKLGWNISDNRVSQVLAHLSHGEFKKAWRVLWEGVDENADFHGKMAEMISKDMHKEVSGKTLFQVKDEKFKDFIQWYAGPLDEAILSAGEKAEEAGGVWKHAASLLAGSNNEIKEKIIVRGFLQKHEKRVHQIMAVNENTTVEMVLKEIYTDITGKAVPVKPGEESSAGPEAVAVVVPPAVQATIEQNYSADEQKEIHQLSAQVFGNKEKQQREIFGENGLMKRLELMAQKDPDCQKKVDRLNELAQTLEEKRKSFTEALTVKKPIDELKTLASECKEAEEEFEKTCAVYYEDIRTKMPGWAPLPLLAYRYSLLTPQERAVFREHIVRVVTVPKRLAIDAREAARDPVGYSQRQLTEAEKELSLYEGSRGLSPSDRAKIKATPKLDHERHAKIRRVEMCEKKVALEKLRKHPGVSAKTLLKAEKEYMDAYQAAFKGDISYLKTALPDPGATLSNREKITYLRNIQQERRALRDACKAYRERTMAIVKTLPENSKEAQRLLRQCDQATELYRATVREELSLWRRFIGEDKGLRKAFVEWVNEENKGGFAKFVRSKVGRVGVVGLLLVPAIYCKYKDIKEKNPEIEFAALMKELGLDSVQILADVCPFTFGASDWYTVSSGKELITGREVHGWDRYSRIIWGVCGTLLDAATVLPAIDVVGAPANAIMRVGRMAGKMREAKKIIGMWPRIKRVAETLGGWKTFAKHLADFKAGKGFAKAAPALRMGATVAPRAAATVMIGGIAYNAIYTMGEDANDPGEEFDPELTKELETAPQEQEKAA
ncbi:hypothetical protein HZC21_00075 [Candidatus Peregrinibacteria bacterium]|nr:hypothetical protein [Candidatus Peregrinibacteria bacterium]